MHEYLTARIFELRSASLLPEHDVQWEQVGPDEARVILHRFNP